MRTKSSSKLVIVILLFVSSTVLATPVFALDRDGGRRDAPIIRFMKHWLGRLGVMPSDELGPPRP